MRWILALVLVGFGSSTAWPCQGPVFAYFDFGRNYPARYSGSEEVSYFIGRVTSFSSDSRHPDRNPLAMVEVLKDYAKPDFSYKRVLGLPDNATMIVKSAGVCAAYMLKAGDVGLFAYYERHGILYLAWER